VSAITEQDFDKVRLEIDEILEGIPPCELHADGRGLTIEFDNAPEVTFDLLSRLALLFGTTKINVRSETRSTGGCDTCDFEYGVAIVSISDVAVWPGVP
jgi:hypothetical protein